MSVAEFIIPRNLEDLEKTPDKDSPSRYFVECIMNVQDMSEPEQVSTLQAIFNEMGSSGRSAKGSGPIAIFHSSKFDTLYSYVKFLSSLGRDSKVLLCNELPQLLKKLCKQIAHILSKRQTNATDPSDRSPAPEVDNQFHVIARSAVKMYCFLISSVIQLIESDPAPTEDGNARPDSASQSQVSTRTRSRTRGGQANAESTDIIDLSTKEAALTSLLELLSSDISPIWSRSATFDTSPPEQVTSDSFTTPARRSGSNTPQQHEGGEIDAGVLTIIYSLVLKLLTNKNNLFEYGGVSRSGEFTAVGHVMHMLLFALNYHFVQQSDIKEDTRIQLQRMQIEESAAENADVEAALPKEETDPNKKIKTDLVESYFRHKSVAADVRDEIISPLCELMMKHDFIAKFLAASVHMIDRESHQRGHEENFMTQDQWTTLPSPSSPAESTPARSELSHTPGITVSSNTHTETAGSWHRRFLRGIFEAISECCGVQPAIVEIKETGEPNNTAEAETQNSAGTDAEESESGESAAESEPKTDQPVPKAATEKHWKIEYFACQAHIDANSCKNLVVFFEHLSEHHVAIIHHNFDLLKPLLLYGESYDLRKAIVSALQQIAIAKHAKLTRLKASLSKGTSQDAVLYKEACESYLETLNLLFMRLMDVSFVVRTHCVKVFSHLWERKILPLPYQLKVLEAAVLRLEDRNNHTRKAAFHLINTAISNNSFTGKFLSLRRIKAKHDEVQRSIEEGSAMPRDSYAPEGGLASEDAGSPMHSRLSFSSMAELSGMQGSSTVIDGEPAPRRSRGPEPSLDEKKQKLRYYTMGIRFIEMFHKGIESAFNMLKSRVLADITEAIDLISRAHELRVDTALEDAYKIFPLIYSDEIAVQDAIRSAFCNMMFTHYRRQTNIPLLYRNIACIRNLMRMLAMCNDGIIGAVETICKQLASQKPLEAVITDDILSTVWGIAVGEAETGNLRFTDEEVVENADLHQRRYAMKLYSILVHANLRSIRDRMPEIAQEVLPKWSADCLLSSYLFESIERLTLYKSFAPLPHSDPLIGLVAQQIVRPTSHIQGWMIMAESGISLISSVCENSYEILETIMQTMESRVKQEVPAACRKKLFSMPEEDGDEVMEESDDTIDTEAVQNVLTQFIFTLGHAAMKQFVHIDKWERAAQTKVECGDDAPPLFAKKGDTAANAPKPKTPKRTEGTDAMNRELGFDSKEFKREEVREAAEKARDALFESGAIAKRYADSLIKWVGHFLQTDTSEVTMTQDQEISAKEAEILSNVYLRTTTTLTLNKFMIISEPFCRQNIRMLFTVLRHSPHWWIRTNCLIGIGDLLCAHPNVVQPYLHPSQEHITALLDPSTEPRTRCTAVTICVHLALNDMMRIPEMTPYLLALIADDDPAIASMGVSFLHELHSKNKNFVYNMLPVVVIHLSKNFEDCEGKFVQAMRPILSKIEKDKQAESIIDKLCSRFPAVGASRTTAFDLTVARYITFCLSELNYASDRVVGKVCADSNFNMYKRWLFDDKIRKLFSMIATKARRSGFSTSAGDERENALSQGASQRGGARADRRGRVAILDEWEARIEQHLQQESQADAFAKQTPKKQTVNSAATVPSAPDTREIPPEQPADLLISPPQSVQPPAKRVVDEFAIPADEASRIIPVKKEARCLDPDACDAGSN